MNFTHDDPVCLFLSYDDMEVADYAWEREHMSWTDNNDVLYFSHVISGLLVRKIQAVY